MIYARYRYALCAGPVLALLLAASASAGEVTGLTSFTAGTPAVAAEVNANFAAVKTAVDDNHGRLTNVETDKQDRVAGTCAAGSAVRQINADGSVVCQHQAGVGYQSSVVNAVTPITNTLQTVAAVSITAPGPGYVIVSFSGSVHFNHTENLNQELRYALVTSPTGNPTPGWNTFRMQHVTETLPSGHYHQPASVQYVYSVAGAGTRTFYLNAYSTEPSGSPRIDLSNWNLNAIFVPNGY